MRTGLAPLWCLVTRPLLHVRADTGARHVLMHTQLSGSVMEWVTHHDSVALCSTDVQCCALVIVTNVHGGTRPQQPPQQLRMHTATRQTSTLCQIITLSGWHVQQQWHARVQLSTVLPQQFADW
jgi:hypothetical protein